MTNFLRSGDNCADQSGYAVKFLVESPRECALRESENSITQRSFLKTGLTAAGGQWEPAADQQVASSPRVSTLGHARPLQPHS